MAVSGLINSMMYWLMRKRYRNIETYRDYPIESQKQIFTTNLYTAKDTEIGKKYGFQEIASYSDFVKKVPLVHYEDFQPYIERTRNGEEDVLWPGKIKYFAKSSGTTNAQSKFIPITEASLEDCHFKAGKDMFAMYCNNHPEDTIFGLTNLRLGGSKDVYKEGQTTYGDLSAILIENLPIWTDIMNAPNRKISLMSEWNEKLELITKDVIGKDIGSFTGVPSWMLVLMEKIKKEKNAKYIDEVWPNIQVFFHGGVSFKPYKKVYESLFSKPINYYEIYNASEGFFAIQDQYNSHDLLLLTDHGIFYEFIALSDFGNENPKTYPLEEVEVGVNYVIVISTNGGLWRYILGDTVRFTSVFPFRLVVTGRTKHFINAFGEELVVENADSALQDACEEHACRLLDYTAGPVYMKNGLAGSHEWIIEFTTPPKDINLFRDSLDSNLQKLNSDYQAKRYNNITLLPPVLHQAKTNLFYSWMESRGKLGGQNKVPRLVNDRKYLDSLLELNNS